MAAPRAACRLGALFGRGLVLTAPIHVLVPCRAGSVRVPGKNTRPFAGDPGGLIGVKLDQLAACEEYASIVVTTDDPAVRAVAEERARRSRVPIAIHDRPPSLAIADTLDAFVAHVPEIVPDGVVAWTHVTSPLFGTALMDEAARAFRREVEDGPADSLMTVETVRSFVWDEEGCVSHDRSAVKWPQTQDLRPLYVVNSALFMIDRTAMIARRDRVGDRPFLFETDPISGFDIDWPSDFALAERLYPAIQPLARPIPSP